MIIDASTADVKTDLGGLATGGGIGVLASVEGVAEGSVFLIAPQGTVDAGDAGIRATGSITLAAAEVRNGDNITAGGFISGAPTAAPPAAPNVAGLASGSNAAGAATSAMESVSQQAGESGGCPGAGSIHRHS